MYPEGSRYVGEFLNSRRHGNGLLTQNNNIFRGTFINDAFEGTGSYQGENGECYEGEWKNNERHGKGVYEWPDGKVYQGEYVNGKR